MGFYVLDFSTYRKMKISESTKVIQKERCGQLFFLENDVSEILFFGKK